MQKSILSRSGLLLVLSAILAGSFSFLTSCGRDHGTAVYSQGDNTNEATTLPATAVTGTAATLNGYVASSRSCDTYWWFEWSYNPDLSKFEGETPHVKCPGSGTYNYSISLTGLNPQTTYHYRIASERDAPCFGQYYGSTLVFITSSP